MIFLAFKYFFRLLFPIYFRWKVTGREKVPASGGVIVAANHTSFLDPPLVGTALIRQAYFLARQDLFRFRPFGWLLKSLNTIPLSRDRTSVASFRAAVKILSSGNQLVIFPEGTRNKEEKLGPARAGLGLLWFKSGVPVVPVYISGAQQAFPPGSRWIRPRKISIVFGDPIRIEEAVSVRGNKVDYKRLSQAVMKRIERLREQKPAKETDFDLTPNRSNDNLR